MYIAERAHQHQAMVAAKVSMERVVFDGRPVLPLDDRNSTLLIPYADNLNIVGVDKEKVQSMKNTITDHLNSIGFITHEKQGAETQAEALGFWSMVEVVASCQGLTNVRGPAKVLLRLASGRMIERVIGHCVHFFMLRLECLSWFRAIYDFKQAERVTLWKAAAEECRQAAALLVMCYADLKCSWGTEVTCSDASLSGTGVRAAQCDLQYN